MALKYDMPSKFTLRSQIYGNDMPLRDLTFEPLDYDRDGFTVRMTVLPPYAKENRFPKHGVMLLLKHKEYRADYKLFCSLYDDALKHDQSEAWGKNYEIVYDFIAGHHERDLQADLADNAKMHDEDLFELKQKMRKLEDLLYYTRGDETVSRERLKAVLGYKE